jgi:hypothetical protein
MVAIKGHVNDVDGVADDDVDVVVDVAAGDNDAVDADAI